VGAAELTVAVTAKPRTTCVCGKNAYQVKVTNKGPIAAHSIVISVPLPAGTTFIGSASPGWRLAGRRLTTTLKDTLAPGASRTVKLTLKVDCTYPRLSLSVQAEITAWTDQTGQYANGPRASTVVPIRCKEKPALS
jgi:hypothetical protein